MSKFLISAATVLMMTAPAFADEQACDSPAQDQWIAEADLTAMYVELGYDVKGIKIEKGCYEVYGVDTTGARVEIIVNPMTGEALGTEGDSN